MSDADYNRGVSNERHFIKNIICEWLMNHENKVITKVLISQMRKET